MYHGKPWWEDESGLYKLSYTLRKIPTLIRGVVFNKKKMEIVRKEEDGDDEEEELKTILFYQFEYIPNQTPKVCACFLLFSLFLFCSGK